MKKNLLNKISAKTTGITTGIIMMMGGALPVKAASMPTISVDGMDNVATTLQNFVKYLGLFFIAAGVVTFAFGAYKLFSSVKSQDGDSRSSAILEIAAGLGAIAVGTGCATFATYITL